MAASVKNGGRVEERAVFGSTVDALDGTTVFAGNAVTDGCSFTPVVAVAVILIPTVGLEVTSIGLGPVLPALVGTAATPFAVGAVDAFGKGKGTFIVEASFIIASFATGPVVLASKEAVGCCFLCELEPEASIPTAI